MTQSQKEVPASAAEDRTIDRPAGIPDDEEVVEVVERSYATRLSEAADLSEEERRRIQQKQDLSSARDGSR
jgi:hypothetical protein